MTREQIEADIAQAEAKKIEALVQANYWQGYKDAFEKMKAALTPDPAPIAPQDSSTPS